MVTEHSTHKDNHIIYKPVLFIVGSFLVTWCCIWLMAETDYHTHMFFFTFLDFMENASPLFCALLLLWRYLLKEKYLWKFFLGESEGAFSYMIVFLLFIVQFFNFYLFRMEDAEVSWQTFAVTFAGQFLLGGGLEEAGWRGYLLPCFCRKHNMILSSAGVSMIWVLWHLPYFCIPGSRQADGSFLSYAVIGVITGFILTAIWRLTKSVLLCMLFHSWQNTIVMTVQADMGDVRFLLVFVLLGAVSMLLCRNKKKHLTME